MKDLDVVDQKRFLQGPTGPAGPPIPPGIDAADFAPGVYDTCPLGELSERTKSGWRLVRLLRETHLRTVRIDALAPADIVARQLTEGYGNAGRHHHAHRGYDERGNPVVPEPERGSVSLFEQIPVDVTIALLVRDEASAIAAAEAAKDAAQAGYREQAQRASDAEKEAKQARKEKEAAEQDRDRHAGDIATLRKDALLATDRLRRMEKDIGELRSEKQKLINAVGKIKADEILGSESEKTKT